MSDIVRVQIHKSLTEVLNDLGKDLAVNLKSKYNLKEITVPRTLASQIAAAKLSGTKTLNVKVRKIGKDRGMLEIL